MAFMDYQKPSDVDFNGAIQNFLAIKKSKQDAALADQQQKLNALSLTQKEQDMADAKQYKDLSNQYINAADTVDETGKVTKTKADAQKEIGQKMMVLNPDQYNKIVDTAGKLSDQDYNQHVREAETIGKTGFAVAQNPQLLGQIFQTLPKNIQAQVVSMGYDPANPNDPANLQKAKQIGDYYTQLGVDVKTAYTESKADARTDKTIASNEKVAEGHDKTSITTTKMNNDTSTKNTQISADATIEGHKINAGASKYAADVSAKTQHDKIDHDDKTYGKANLQEAAKTARFILEHSYDYSPEEIADAKRVIAKVNSGFMGDKPPANKVPTKDGSTVVQNGKTYILKNGQWLKQ